MITQASGFDHTSQAEPNKHQSKVISPRQQSSQRASLKAQSWARYSSFLYMNDLPLHIDNNIDMFADDSTLYTSGHNVDEIQHSLQTNLNAVTTWCEENRMVINTAKTKCMLITTKQRRHNLRNNQLAITLNDQQLQQVKQHKVIGVDVDENLQWREHVTGVFKKVSQNLALFRRIKHFLPKWSNIMFYNECIYHASS